jgi:LPS-assembly protein
MKLQQKITSIIFALSVYFASNIAYAIPSLKSKDKDAPSILKADQIDGDRLNNSLIADGNVEITKGNSIFHADKVTYEKDGGMIKAFGNIRAKNLEVGNLTAGSAEVKDDFSSGEFLKSKIIFDDGSYLISPKIERKSQLVTILQSPIYSICPNPEISNDNEIAGKKSDFASIKSDKTTIDREEEVIRSRGAVLRIYDVPLLYTPYLSVGLPSKKRKSGFLTPSYIRTSNLGLGVRVPYYVDIAPNVDLITAPIITINNQFVIENKFRHLTSYGSYVLEPEIANNEIKRNIDSNITNRTKKDLRWRLKGEGSFDYNLNTGLDFKLNFVGDRDYGRDYHFDYITNYTLSHVNLDNIKGRDYQSVKLIKIQELENEDYQRAEPFIVPINSYIETKPNSGNFKEKFALTSNATTIVREDGVQYRRVSATPEFSVPLNLKGNLFTFDTKVQGDLYSIENNSRTLNQELDKTTQSNYKPEISLNWKLPLIKKSQKSTLMIEPMANFVVSTYKKSFNQDINEDSNDNELTVSNLFVSDRISGFDRNESGKRLNYGVKSSLFNNYGEFGLTVGQGYKKGDNQDVAIRGFGNNNKSNFVGQASYKAVKYLSLNYSFQLNQANFRNEVNQLQASLDFDKITFSSNYLLIRRSEQNLDKKEQVSLNSGIKLNKDWKMNLTVRKDLITNRTLSRSVIFDRDGCCTNFMFSVTETNPSTLSKPQKSFNISLQFKNL